MTGVHAPVVSLDEHRARRRTHELEPYSTAFGALIGVTAGAVATILITAGSTLARRLRAWPL